MGWVGVDLDGTLAHYDGWKGPKHVGDPIPAMLERVMDWIRHGQEVRIFTARASVPEYIPYVEQWLEENGIGGLQVTCIKDFECIEIWDDRAVQVVLNTGMTIAQTIQNNYDRR